MPRRNPDLPPYSQAPRGRNAPVRAVRYNRWPAFWEDCLSALELAIQGWPKTLLRQILFETFVTGPDALKIVQDAGDNDRTLSPDQLAELILSEFLVANARARGYAPKGKTLMEVFAAEQEKL